MLTLIYVHSFDISTCICKIEYKKIMQSKISALLCLSVSNTQPEGR